MDTILVKRFNEAGEVTGLRLLLGLFTSASYFRPRTTSRCCATRCGAARSGPASPRTATTARRCNTSSIASRATSCSRSATTQLLETALGILHLQQRQRIALFVLRDPFDRFVTCLVYMPRDRYSTEIRGAWRRS